MRVKKAEIEKGVIAKILSRKEPPAPAPVDRSDEILTAIKNINLQPVVDHRIPEEILKQQRLMLEKIAEISKSSESSSYHFKINRSSDGYIKSVDVTPTKNNTIKRESIEKTWYNKDKNSNG